MERRLDIGGKLRALRNERRISLRTLAKLSGLSVNTLSLIERNITSPTVNTLYSISRALGVKISHFFDEERTEDLLFTKADARTVVEMKEKGVKVESLGVGLVQQGLEGFVITARQGCKGLKKGSQMGDELLFCLKGKFQINVNKDTFTMEEGDALLVKGNLLYRWESTGEGESQLLVVKEARK